MAATDIPRPSEVEPALLPVRNERVRRLVSRVTATFCPAAAGWVGGGLIAGLLGLAAAAWLAEPTRAGDEPVPGPARSITPGQVPDQAAGVGVPGPVDVGEVTSDQPAKVTIKASGGQARALAFAPVGKVLAIVTGTEGGFRGGPGELQIYEDAGRRLLTTVKEPAGIRAVAFAPDGKTLATGGSDRTVKVRDAATGAVLATLGEFGNHVSAVAFAPDGKSLATGCLDESVKLWDTATWEATRSTILTYGQSVLSLAFAPDGQGLAVGTGEPGEAWER